MEAERVPPPQKKQVQRFGVFISALLAKEACDLAGVFQQMECDATPPAPHARTDNLLRATETTDNLVVWGGWGASRPNYVPSSPRYLL